MLINCVAYQNGNKLADISVDDIGAYLARPDCLVWVALHDPTETELAKMQQQFHLHDLAVEDARKGHQRPKIEEYGDSLFMVMHTLESVDGEIRQGEVDLFVGRNFVLSIRNHSEQPLLSTRARCESKPELLKQGSGFVLYALMDAVVDRYFPLLDTFDAELDAIEERIFEQETARNNVRQLYELKRKVVLLKHAVGPLMEQISNFLGNWMPAMFASGKDYFRDIYDHLVRINTSVDTLRDTINTAILVCQSTVSLEQNEISKRLAAWAGIFAVITALAGIWGMNFHFMPELGWMYGYPLALVIMTAAGGLLYWRFRRSGWL